MDREEYSTAALSSPPLPQLGPDALPPTPTDRLVSVALYGRASDMHATLLRYGPVTLDMRVEPLGLNALHVAVRRGCLPMVLVLLEHGADPNQPTSSGVTPLLLACRLDAGPIADALLARADLHSTSLSAHETEQRMTPLMWAALHCNAALVEAILAKARAMRVPPASLARAANRYGHTAAMLAAAAGPARMGCANGERGRWALGGVGPDPAVEVSAAAAAAVAAAAAAALIPPASPSAAVASAALRPVVLLPAASPADSPSDACGLDDKSGGVLAALAADDDYAAAMRPRSPAFAQSQPRVPVAALRLSVSHYERSALVDRLRVAGSRSRLVSWPAPPTFAERRAVVARAASIVNTLLALEATAAARAVALGGSAAGGASSRSLSGWTTLHHAARSGALAFLDWSLVLPLTPRQRLLWGAAAAVPTGGSALASSGQAAGGGDEPLPAPLVDVNAAARPLLGRSSAQAPQPPPHSGLRSASMRQLLPSLAEGLSSKSTRQPATALAFAPNALHLAAWNGQAGVLAALLLGPWQGQGGRPNAVAPHALVNALLAVVADPAAAAAAAAAMAGGSGAGGIGGGGLVSAQRALRRALASAATPLDLALLKRHTQCARILCRAGGVARACAVSGARSPLQELRILPSYAPAAAAASGAPSSSLAHHQPQPPQAVGGGGGSADEFLWRCVLLGDGVTAERLLRADENGLRVSPPIIEVCARLKYPETCTATFAQAHHPAGQWMHECAACGVAVCLVCRDACHPHCAWEAAPAASPTAAAAAAAAAAPAATTPTASAAAAAALAAPPPARRHELRSLGFLASVSCACSKQTCRAIGAIDPREAAGFTWVPNPLDTRGASGLDMRPGSELGVLVDKLAWNSHEVRPSEDGGREGCSCGHTLAD